MFNPLNIFNRNTEMDAEPSELIFEIGDTVTVAGLPGTLKAIGISPYWPEERDNILRGYIVSTDGRWADWFLASDLVLVGKATTAAFAAAV